MTGIFDNDGAVDWLQDFTEHPDPVKISSAFRLTGDSHEYPDALDCEEALAAAAVILSLKKGVPVAGLPNDKFELLRQSGINITDDMYVNALQSARHILSGSELKDLWEEDEQYGEWELSVKELIQAFS